MKNLKLIKKSKLITLSLSILILLTAVRFIPWDRVNWGKLELLPGSAITVTGEAKQPVQTQIARFSAGVTVANVDKQTAVNQTNQDIDAVIKAVKDFGIVADDIQTQTISVYQEEDRDGSEQWRASNSVEIILRQPDQASALADLLQQSPATNVSGPRFSLDDTQSAQLDLLQLAIDNAREKAATIAKASGRKLGKVLTVSEGAASQPVPVLRTMEARLDGGVPTPVEPGTETVYKTVTVTFELN